MSIIAQAVNESLQTKEYKNITLKEWFKKKLYEKKVSKKEMKRIANSDAFRMKLLFAGGYDFGLTEGCTNFANATVSKDGNINFPVSGARKFSKTAEAFRIEYVDMIFKTQGYRDLFYYISPAGLSPNWPKPTSFHHDELHYQTDHLLSSRYGGPNSLENYCFLTANINEYLKNQASIEQLLNIYCELTAMCDSVRNGLKERKKLFASQKWTDFLTKIFEFEYDPSREFFIEVCLKNDSQLEKDVPNVSVKVEPVTKFDDFFVRHIAA